MSCSVKTQSSQTTFLQRLLDESKGKTTYSPDQAFLLHVFWECPSLSAAQNLLDALRRCAAATHRDTPCVPLYFFRISSNNADLCPPTPRYVRDHTRLVSVQRKLRMGVPRPAVLSELARYGLNDSALLDLDPSAELPVELWQSAVALEFTELYLDERAFWEHSGSRDYLDAYGAVLNPALLNRKCTLRMGRPTEYLRERVLELMLQERVVPVLDGMVVWRQPASGGDHILVSLDLDASAGMHELVEKLPLTTLEPAVVSVLFQHPFRGDTVRLLAVLPASTDLNGLDALDLQRGEVHCNQDVVHQIQKKVDAAGLGPLLTINAAASVGYVLHGKAHDLMVMQDIKSNQDQNNEGN